MSHLRDAARTALEMMDPQAEGSGDVSRVVLDVHTETGNEWVTVELREGKLVTHCAGGAESGHVAAALSFVAGREAGESSAEEPPGARMSHVPEVPRVSWAPPGDAAVDEPSARSRLAQALEDVVTVVVRAGAANPDSPSLREALARLRKEAPLPTPAGLGRWLGRLSAALESNQAVVTAALLRGAAMLAEDLRRAQPSAEARRRVVGWLGASGERGSVERLSDRTMVEVARELLASSERGGIERRYLVDLHNGEVFREERCRSSPSASVGPCPRLIRVGLAEVEVGTSPRRIHLMQYVVSLDPNAAELRRVGANAYRRFAALADRYRQQLAADPGQAEPFAVIAPKRWIDDPEGPRCYDDDDQPLPFASADDSAAVAHLGAVVPRSGPRWVAGRLTDASGKLMMVPVSVAIADGAETRLIRLR